MRVYLASGNANYASENDGYEKALRMAEHKHTLYSFICLTGLQRLPIYESLSGSRSSELVALKRVGSRSKSG
jgi:hypothetical protein